EVVDLHRVVLLVDEHDAGPVRGGLLRRHVRVGDHDDLVAGGVEPGGGAVEADRAAARRGGDGVRFEPRAVVDVDDLHLLVGQDLRRLQQLGVEGDGALVVEVGLRHREAMELPLEHRNGHARGSLVAGTAMKALSMSRAPSKKTATVASTSCPGRSVSTGRSVSVSTISAYCSSASGAASMADRIESTRVAARRSPCRTASRAPNTA